MHIHSPNSFLPQGLCICCSRCLEHCSLHARSRLRDREDLAHFMPFYCTTLFLFTAFIRKIYQSGLCIHAFISVSPTELRDVHGHVPGPCAVPGMQQVLKNCLPNNCLLEYSTVWAPCSHGKGKPAMCQALLVCTAGRADRRPWQ